jgi:hypothetical protein
MTFGSDPISGTFTTSNYFATGPAAQVTFTCMGV